MVNRVKLEEMAYKDLLVHLESVCKDNLDEMDSKEKPEKRVQQVSKVIMESLDILASKVKKELVNPVKLEEMAYKDLLVNLEEMDSKETPEQQVPKVMRELPENLDCPEEMAYLETKAQLV